MKKHNITKPLLALFVFAAALIMVGCSSDDDGGDPAPSQTVMEVVNSDTGGSDGLDSLSKYLNNYPDLVSMLNADGEVTLFAPTNAAFVSLMQTPGFPEDISDINPDIIKAVLAYHVVPGATVTSSGFVENATFNTAYTDEASGTVQVIAVNADGTLLTGASNKSIQISETDIRATNGVVHKVGSVLIPPAIGERLSPILGTLAGTVLLSADFTYLADLVAVADSEVPEGAAPVSATFASQGTHTAFLPPNPVFEGAAQSEDPEQVAAFINSFDPPTARAILLTHITADGSVASSEFTDGASYTALSEVPLTITVEGTPTNSPTGFLISSPGSANVPIVGVDINHSNGIAHVIAGLLLPQ